MFHFEKDVDRPSPKVGLLNLLIQKMHTHKRKRRDELEELREALNATQVEVSDLRKLNGAFHALQDEVSRLHEAFHALQDEIQAMKAPVERRQKTTKDRNFRLESEALEIKILPVKADLARSQLFLGEGTLTASHGSPFFNYSALTLSHRENEESFRSLRQTILLLFANHEIKQQKDNPQQIKNIQQQLDLNGVPKTNERYLNFAEFIHEIAEEVEKQPKWGGLGTLVLLALFRTTTFGNIVRFRADWRHRFRAKVMELIAGDPPKDLETVVSISGIVDRTYNPIPDWKDFLNADFDIEAIENSGFLCTEYQNIAS